MTRKKVDDVLGGEDAWKNVDSIEGKEVNINGFLLIIIYYTMTMTMIPLTLLLIIITHLTTSLLATCPKCENNRAYYMQIQIRSADEPSSIFYKCCRNSCGHQWREG